MRLFARMLASASFSSPTLKRLKVSSEKAEKVVKLPNKPMKRNSRILSEILPANSAKVNPIKKEPTALTTKVPTGKIPL